MDNEYRGWFKVYRKFDEWGWYHDSVMVHLFIHCLIKANYQRKEWKGIIIERGQFITSLDKLCYETGISRQMLRNRLSKLKSTHELTYETTHHFTLITVINYDSYQEDKIIVNTAINTETNISSTHGQHTVNTNEEIKKQSSKKLKALSSKEDIPFSEIVSHLNTRTKKAYRDTGAKIRGLITARWNEGFRVSDFERVIDNQVIKWEHDPKMREFLRPETIFGTKFESYLNAVPNMAQAGLVSAGTQSLLSWAERKMKEAEDANGRQPEIR